MMGCSPSSPDVCPNRPPKGTLDPHVTAAITPPNQSTSMTSVTPITTLTGRASVVGHLLKLTLPLTEREVFLLTRSWKGVRRKITETGIRMFLTMFTQNSEVKDMFQNFRVIENDALAVDLALENHALVVMNALDEVITNMDDVDYIYELLMKTGKSHRRFTNFSPLVFWKIEEPFLVAAKETLGERYTQNMERIYKRTVKTILTILCFSFRNDDVDGRILQAELTKIAEENPIVTANGTT